MATRVKTFESTGLAPNGRLYAGDLNAMQDAAADQINLMQEIRLGSLAIGEVALKLLRFGAGEARLTGALRTDGIFRGLGGLFAGSFTTQQRDAIPAGSRPYGLIILNTTTNQLEWNRGNDTSPSWVGIGGGGAGQAFNNQVSSYTLVLADAGKVIEMNSGSANTLTVPTDANVAFQVGTTITIAQQGTGVTTIAPASGVTIRAFNNNRRSAGQNAICSVIKRATNDWWLVGNLVP